MPLEIMFWNENTWTLQNSRNIFVWGQQTTKDGIVGLDFSCCSLDTNNDLKLRKWCKRIFFGFKNVNDNKGLV